MALILVKGRGSADLQAALLKTRRSLNSRNSRNQSKRAPRTKLLSTRPNPMLTYSTITRRNITNGVDVPPLGGASFRYISYSRGWSSVSTPDFKSKRRKRLRLPINPYSVTISEVSDGKAVEDNWTSDGSGSFSTHVSAYQDKWGTRDFGGDPQRPAIDTSVDFRAIRKLIDRVGPSNNIAQDFAQMGQTTKMIADSAKRIAAAVIATRKGNFSAAAANLWHSKTPKYHGDMHPSASRSLADNWLAYQYGWKPLLQDIQGSMESLARLNLGQTQTWNARASASSETSGRLVLSQNVAQGRNTGAQSWVSRTTVRYGMRYKYDDHITTFFAQTGFTNPINLAWEVLPYSFVVDWFLPIGPYLESFSAWDGLAFVDGWKSTSHEVINIWDVSFNGPSNPADPHDVHMEAKAGACRHRWFSYDRIPLSGFPSPKFPSFKNPVSPTHALNALALLRSAFKG